MLPLENDSSVHVRQTYIVDLGLSGSDIIAEKINGYDSRQLERR